jgi:predicted nucleic acid-binding protein
MKFFDASAILNLIKRGNFRAFLDGITLDLALYECLNAIWKEFFLLKNIDGETALEFAKIVGEVFATIQVVSAGGFENEILEFASKNGITAYDASYVVMAIKKEATFVTDDEKLRKIASNYLKAISGRDI